MNLKTCKETIQDTYDKGLFAGISLRDNRIILMVKEGAHWIENELNTDYPVKDFPDLKLFVDSLGKPKKVNKLDETI